MAYNCLFKQLISTIFFAALETPSQIPSNITFGTDRTQERSTALSSRLGWTTTPNTTTSSNGFDSQRTSTNFSNVIELTRVTN